MREPSMGKEPAHDVLIGSVNIRQFVEQADDVRIELLQDARSQELHIFAARKEKDDPESGQDEGIRLSFHRDLLT
jgi:hypothetical protein